MDYFNQLVNQINRYADKCDEPIKSDLKHITENIQQQLGEDKAMMESQLEPLKLEEGVEIPF